MFMAKKANEIQNGDLKRNIVILRSAYGKVGQQYFIQPCRDKFGNLPTSVRRIDSRGDMMLSDEDKKKPIELFIPENQMFVIEDGKTFDLNDPRQAAEWEAVRHCFLIAESRDARDANGDYLIDGTRNPNARQPRYGRAELYVERPGILSEKRVTRTKLVVKAKNFIINDERGYDGLIIIAKVLGRNMVNQPAADVEDYLLSVADKTPEKIIELYTGGDLQLKLLFITAKEKGIIHKEHGLYTYGEDENVTLGASDSAVLEWMKQPRNQKTLQLIRQDTYPEMYID